MQVYVRIVRRLREEGRLFALHNATMGRSLCATKGPNSDLPNVMLVQISTTTIPITVDLTCHRHVRLAQCAPDDPGELSGALYRR
jgi:hypothetical protein